MTKLISLFEAHHDRHELLHHRYDLFQLFMRTGGLFKADALSTLGLSQDGCVLRRGEQVYGLNCWEGTLPGEPDLIRSIESKLEYIDLGRSHTSILDVPKLISDKTRHLSLSEGLHDDYVRDVNIELQNIQSLDLSGLCLPEETRFFERHDLSKLSYLGLFGTSFNTASLLRVLSNCTSQTRLVLGNIVDMDDATHIPEFEAQSVDIQSNISATIVNRITRASNPIELFMYQNKIDISKKDVALFCGLNKLDISCARVQPGFVDDLIQRTPTLSTLILDWIPLGVDEIKAVFQSGNIRSLSLNSTELIDSKLEGALTKGVDSKVEFLDLSLNSITAESLRCLIDSGVAAKIIGLNLSMPYADLSQSNLFIPSNFPRLKYLSVSMEYNDRLEHFKELQNIGFELKYLNGVSPDVSAV